LYTDANKALALAAVGAMTGASSPAPWTTYFFFGGAFATVKPILVGPRSPYRWWMCVQADDHIRAGRHQLSAFHAR